MKAMLHGHDDSIMDTTSRHVVPKNTHAMCIWHKRVGHVSDMTRLHNRSVPPT